MARKKGQKGPLKAEVKCRINPACAQHGAWQPWWVRVSYPNGRGAYRSETYTRKRDAENAAMALAERGVYVKRATGESYRT